MPKNLLMITGLGSAKDLASGRQGAFYNTLEEFHKYWDRIDIITPRVNNSKESIFDNVFIHSSPWRPIVFHPLFFIYKILKLNKKISFNLMTVQEFPPFYNGIGAWIVSVITKIPYVLEIHHIPGYPKAGNVKEKIYRQLMNLFLCFDVKRSKAVRVVNQKETPSFLIKAGVPREKIKYIPSMYIDSEVFRPMGLSKKYDVIFVGRLEANKGINLLLQAIKILPDFKFKIIGDGSLNKIVKEAIGLLPNMSFSPGVQNHKDVAELINESRVLLMPSYNEGGPRVVFEAMACGVPVLATKVGLIPDLADKNVVKIIDWNAEDIAKKIKELLGNENEKRRMETAGLEIVKQFEKKAAIENYARELQKLIP
jgi:glycosyltransferase involved in cell wall biosynthesis